MKKINLEKKFKEYLDSLKENKVRSIENIYLPIPTSDTLYYDIPIATSSAVQKILNSEDKLSAVDLSMLLSKDNLISYVDTYESTKIIRYPGADYLLNILSSNLLLNEIMLILDADVDGVSRTIYVTFEKKYFETVFNILNFIGKEISKNKNILNSYIILSKDIRLKFIAGEKEYHMVLSFDKNSDFKEAGLSPVKISKYYKNPENKYGGYDPLIIKNMLHIC